MTRTQPESVDPKGPAEITGIHSPSDLRATLPTSAPSAGRDVVFDPREGFYPQGLLESAAFVSATSRPETRRTLNPRKVTLMGLVLIAIGLAAYIYWIGGARFSNPALPGPASKVAGPVNAVPAGSVAPAETVPAPSATIDRAATAVSSPPAPRAGERTSPATADRPSAPRPDRPVAIVPAAPLPVAPLPVAQGTAIAGAVALQPSVTHTKAAGVAPIVPVPVPAAAPAPRSATRATVAPALPAGTCTEAIAALGLCDDPSKREGK